MEKAVYKRNEVPLKIIKRGPSIRLEPGSLCEILKEGHLRNCDINTEQSTMEEVRNAIKSLRIGKAQDIDIVHVKMLKAGNVFQNLFICHVEDEDLPSDWS
ncbi:Hypothetical predicted protein [Mytilus galloprovincialis]|uniref:Uncharacterized protein n=1 Tax=Mytilus galloprovincialis TaxID=29158 RepID=A0A8B6CWL3_MYTGA|nr:Hypothetical predicted protein [Mytilus galloprovincialis]